MRNGDEALSLGIVQHAESAHKTYGKLSSEGAQSLCPDRCPIAAWLCAFCDQRIACLCADLAGWA